MTRRQVEEQGRCLDDRCGKVWLDSRAFHARTKGTCPFCGTTKITVLRVKSVADTLRTMRDER